MRNGQTALNRIKNLKIASYIEAILLFSLAVHMISFLQQAGECFLAGRAAVAVP